jgi:type VI secretion system secreted protein Hcp
MALADYVLVHPDFPGESKLIDGGIDILTFEIGVTQTGTIGFGGGGGAGKAKPEDLLLVKNVDKASPALWIAACTGKHHAKAELHMRKAGGKQETFCKFVLTDFIITSHHLKGAHDSDILPTEHFSIKPTTFEIMYKEQKADGSLSGEVKKKFLWDKYVEQ